MIVLTFGLFVSVSFGWDVPARFDLMPNVIRTEFLMVGEGRPTHAHITPFLVRAKEQKLYDAETVRRSSPLLPARKVQRVTTDGSLPAIRSNFDSYDGREFNGWAFFEGWNSSSTVPELILRDGDIFWSIPLIRCPRPDVRAAFPDQGNVTMSGFRTYLPIYTVPAGRYELGVRLTRDGKSATVWPGFTFISSSE